MSIKSDWQTGSELKRALIVANFVALLWIILFIAQAFLFGFDAIYDDPGFALFSLIFGMIQLWAFALIIGIIIFGIWNMIRGRTSSVK